MLCPVADVVAALMAFVGAKDLGDLGWAAEGRML